MTPLWTIAKITSWDDEPPDTLYPDVATIEAATEIEAVAKYEAEHPYDADYCVISARPGGEPW